MKEFRLLKADEIEVRVGHVSGANANKAMLLLYKDARCDMNILDETLGITGWQRKHQLIDGQLFCDVSIYDYEKDQWITKQDVGVESFSEAEKGRASDAFKRACFNLGIGRELYTAPQIWVTSPSSINNKKEWNYKKFRVKEIGYDDNRKINNLHIQEYVKGSGWVDAYKFGSDMKPYNANNNKGKPIKEKQEVKNDKPKTKKTISDEENKKRELVENMFTVAKQAGIELVKVQERMASKYGKTKSNDLTREEIDEITAWLTQESFI